MKAPHQSITGHDLLAVEQFQNNTWHMTEFYILVDCHLGKRTSIWGVFSARTAMVYALQKRNEYSDIKD